MPPCLKYLRMHFCILDFPDEMKQKKKSEALLDTLTALCYCFVWETIHMEYQSLSHTINKPTALAQQGEAGDRKEMGDKACCSKLPRDWRGRQNKEEAGGEWLCGMGKGTQEQSGLRARESPARQPRAPRARQAGKSKPGRVIGRERPRWKRGSREEKPLKMLSWTRFLCQGAGKEQGWLGPDQSAEGGNAVRFDSSGRTEQEADWAAEPPAPTEMLLWAQHWGRDSWLQSHLCVASQWNVETEIAASAPSSSPARQELRLRTRIHMQNTKNSPSMHMGYTQHHSATLEAQLLKTYFQVTSEKLGFSKSRHTIVLGTFGHFLSSVRSVFDHWNDQILQCTPQTHRAQTWFCHFLPPECLTLYSLNKGLLKVALCG